MVTRLANPEGKGEVNMLDLTLNSLRMRPDRIVLGEVRRQREAEVLFEAMHTGHAVYATLHADDSTQVKNRLVNPPISLPEQLLSALHLIVVQYRQRRSGIRRTLEVAEVIPAENGVTLNVIYRWDPRADTLDKVGEHIRLDSELTLRTGMRPKDIEKDLKEKQLILSSMLAAGITNVDAAGKIFARYYKDPAFVIEAAATGGDQLRKLL
jgi:flagellar protein FlaI